MADTITIFVTQVIREVRNAPGTGTDAYLYIGYADDDQGTGFTTTFHPDKSFIAFKNTTEPIETPVASDFTGLWKSYGGAGNTIEMAATRAAISISANRRFIYIEADEDNNGGKTLAFYPGTAASYTSSDLINLLTS